MNIKKFNLIGLALDAEVHDVVAADGAVVDHDVPSPQRNGVPLLHLEPDQTEKMLKFMKIGKN